MVTAERMGGDETYRRKNRNCCCFADQKKGDACGLAGQEKGNGRDSAFRKERTKKKVSEAFIFAGSDLCAGVGGADGHAAGIRA